MNINLTSIKQAALQAEEVRKTIAELDKKDSLTDESLLVAGEMLLDIAGVVGITVTGAMTDLGASSMVPVSLIALRIGNRSAKLTDLHTEIEEMKNNPRLRV